MDGLTMGRFATTVPLYEKLRPPYPAAFFSNVAQRLRLGKEHALIDLGTGPGLLALGFAPYVGRIVGVDPEPAMLAATRKAAANASKAITLIEGKAEALPSEVGRFDVVTIGRALHWMDCDAIAVLFERLVASDGTILVCSSNPAGDGRNSWLNEYNKARRSWSEPSAGERYHRRLGAVLQRTPFHVTDAITVETSRKVSVNDLARRVLTFSSSSPAVLGNKTEPMLRDVERRLLPLSCEGFLTEVVVSIAQLAKR
jgi:ubiquinone/menaquinone biosynthesis C-methylase UbiE